MSISTPTTGTPSTAATGVSSHPGTPGASNAPSASQQAADALDAGVIATLGAATSDPGADLYTNLANLAAAASASAPPSSATDVNTDWATAVKADPGLAPLAEQMSLNQALLNALL